MCRASRQHRHPPQGKRIALKAAPRDHPIGAQADIGVLAKAFTLVHVGDMNLQHRPVEGVERVQKRDGSMGERGGVDDDPGGGVAGLVDPVDDLSFMV